MTKTTPFVCSGYAILINEGNKKHALIRHCVTKNMSCAFADSLSRDKKLTCVKNGLFK